MKRFWIFVLLGFLLTFPAYGQRARLPLIFSQGDTSGKQGYFDRAGNCIIPCMFDFAAPFKAETWITAVRYAGKYYIIDRGGNMLLLEGFESMPDVYRRFAVISRQRDDGAASTLIDLYGRQISPDGVSVIPLRNAPEEEDPVLFSMGVEGNVVLTDLTFEPLSDVPAVELSQEIFCPEAVVFRDRDFRCGLMNADGEVLIEAGDAMSDLNILHITSVENYRDWLRKAGMYDLYTEEELDDLCLAILSGDGTSTIYDLTGEVVAPRQKRDSEFDLIRRNFKEHIVPYLRRKAENRARFEEKLLQPYARHRAVTLELPEAPVSRYAFSTYLRQQKTPEPANDGTRKLASTHSGTSSRQAAPETSSRPGATSAPSAPSATFAPPAAASAASGVRPGDVPLPEERDLCFTNQRGQLLSFTLSRGELGTFITAYLLPGYSYPRFILSEIRGDRYVFSMFSLSPRSIYRPDAGFDLHLGKPVLTVSRDWKSVVLEDGSVYDIPIPKSVYDRTLIERVWIMEGYPYIQRSSGSTPINSEEEREFQTNKHGWYTCPNCHGTGLCPHCSHGIARNSYLGGDPMICPVCHGKSECQSCDGTGKLYGVIH